MRLMALLAAVAFLAGACETTPTGGAPVNVPASQSVFLKVADTDYRLSGEQRSSVHPAFNVEAVERLLMWTRPEYRAEMLESFQWSSIAALGDKVAIGEITWDVDHPEVRRIASELRAPTRVPDGSGRPAEP